MQSDDKVLVALKNYVASGKKYFEAADLLKQQGYTQLQIDNATYALQSGKEKVENNPELADSLIKVEQITADDHSASDRRKGHTFYPSGGFPIIRLPDYLRSWWPIAIFIVVATLALVYIVK